MSSTCKHKTPPQHIRHQVMLARIRKKYSRQTCQKALKEDRLDLLSLIQSLSLTTRSAEAAHYTELVLWHQRWCVRNRMQIICAMLTQNLHITGTPCNSR